MRSKPFTNNSIKKPLLKEHGYTTHSQKAFGHVKSNTGFVRRPRSAPPTSKFDYKECPHSPPCVIKHPVCVHFTWSNEDIIASKNKTLVNVGHR
jgi:hypothetical protein